MTRNVIIPTVIENDGRVERASDIYSRLLRERVVFIDGEINDQLASSIVAQLLLLEATDPDKEISMYINSPGGSVTAGMAIYDTMNYIQNEISTICIGQAASMASILLAAGTNGKRFALPNSTIMIHQPMSAFDGQQTDVQIHANHLKQTRTRLNQILSDLTGQTKNKISKDTERDNFMTADEAQKYGLIDEVKINRVDGIEKGDNESR